MAIKELDGALTLFAEELQFVFEFSFVGSHVIRNKRARNERAGPQHVKGP